MKELHSILDMHTEPNYPFTGFAVQPTRLTCAGWA